MKVNIFAKGGGTSLSVTQAVNLNLTSTDSRRKLGGLFGVERKRRLRHKRASDDDLKG